MRAGARPVTRVTAVLVRVGCVEYMRWDWVAIASMRKMAGARPPCLHCGRPLQVVGTARQNGVKHHGDWARRRYHKACWAKLQARARSRPAAPLCPRGRRRARSYMLLTR